MSPLGPSQRRLSRSPRSQRSRSADVDCLKKYAERKLFEERKLMDVCDYNKFDASRWIPLAREGPQSSTRVYLYGNDRNDLDPGRSKVDSTRWLPVINRKVCPENIRRNSHGDSQENIHDLKYAKQPAGRSLSSESGSYFRERKNSQFEYCDRETVEKTRWLLSEISTSKYIPSPLARKYSEGSCSNPISNRWMTYTRYPPSPIIRKNPERRSFNIDTRKTENWSERENPKIHTTSEYKTVQIIKQPSIDSVRLNQRIRELYDFKTENDCPKRVGNQWISKSSTDSSFEIDWDERLRKFHEKLRFSEDLSIDKKVQARNRTYSDDYEDYSRRQSSELFEKGIKRNSDASSRSRVSYAEIDFSDFSKRGSRTSDASYASISTYSPKRGSAEFSQRAFNQSERRPSTPVLPKKMNAPLDSTPQRGKKNTRYKVYLT